MRYEPAFRMQQSRNLCLQHKKTSLTVSDQYNLCILLQNLWEYLEFIKWKIMNAAK